MGLLQRLKAKFLSEVKQGRTLVSNTKKEVGNYFGVGERGLGTFGRQVGNIARSQVQREIQPRIRAVRNTINLTDIVGKFANRNLNPMSSQNIVPRVLNYVSKGMTPMPNEVNTRDRFQRILGAGTDIVTATNPLLNVATTADKFLSSKTNKQRLGSLAEGTANALLGGKGQIAIDALGRGLGKNIVKSAGKTVIKNMPRNLVTGTLYGGGSALRQDKSAKEIAKDAVSGAIVAQGADMLLSPRVTYGLSRELLQKPVSKAANTMMQPVASSMGAMPPKGKKGIDDGLDALRREARKYKSAEEFVKAQGTSVYRTEKADIAYKGKAVWGDGKYFGIEKNQVKEMTKSPHSGKSTGGVQRGFVTSVKNAENVEPTVKNLVEGTYIQKPNENLMGEAQALLNDGASIDFKGTKYLDKKVAATIQHAINNQRTNPELSAALYNNLAENATELGRGVQAYNLLQKMSPEAISLSVAGKIQKYNRTAIRKIPELTGEQTKMIADKIDALSLLKGHDKEIAIGELKQTIDNFIPSSIGDKAIAVWKAGLLTSLRTHERNFVGNLIHGVAEIAKDVPAAGADMLMSQATGERSMSVTVRGLGEFGSKSTVQQMKDIISKGIDPTDNISKFDHKTINWGKNLIERGLKFYTETVFRVLQASDKPFYNAAMARSLYDQAGAKAINAGRRGDRAFIENLVRNPDENMVINALSDANTAVFKDRNKATAVASSIKRAMANPDNGVILGEAGKIAGEVVMPFTGVPSSILGQIVAYSPAGLTKGIANAIKVVREAKLPGGGGGGGIPPVDDDIVKAAKGALSRTELINLQRKASQQIGRGVIGSAIFALGVYLAAKGLVTGQPKDAAEQRQWDLENKPRNSIFIGGQWRSLNSIGPEAVVFLAGSKLNEEMSKPDGNVGTYGASLAKDFLDQSFVTGIQQPVNAITDPARYGKSYAGNLLSSFAAPNIIKDAAKGTDTVQREPNTVFDYTKASIPIWRKTLLPKRGVTGEPMPQEPRGINTFVDLFNSKTPTNNTIVNELSRLNAAGTNATPSKISPNQTIFGQKLKLTPEELDKLEEQSGGQLRSLLNQTISNPSYSALTDEEKKTVIGNVVEDVRKISKENLATGVSSFSASGLTNKYQTQMDQSVFEQSGKKSATINGTYFFQKDDGTTGHYTQSEMEFEINSQKMSILEENKSDFKQWNELATKNLDALNKQWQESAGDPLGQLKIENKIIDLQQKIAKYAGYGGFTKAKKEKTYNLATVQKVNIKTAKPAYTTKIRSQRPKRVKFKSPKIKTYKLKAPKAPKLKKLRSY